MKIRTRAGGIMNPPEERSGIDSLVVKTDEGDPVVVAINLEGNICVATINDPNFGEYMRMLGYKAEDLPEPSVVDV